MPPGPEHNDTWSREDYLDVPVKFLGKYTSPKTTIVAGKYGEVASRLFNTPGSHKSLRGNVPKDLLLNLSTSVGQLTALPQNGGLALSISLATIQAVESSASKFAIIADDDPNPLNRSLYGFQFKRKEMVDGFVKALRTGFVEFAGDSSSRKDSGSPPFGSRNPVDVHSPRRPNDSRAQQLEERIRDLEKLLAEEKARASMAEVNHLQSVVKCVSAERECAEMKAEMAEMRAEMASVAAEMASEMSNMKSKVSQEHNQGIMSEMNALRASIESVAGRLSRRASKHGILHLEGSSLDHSSSDGHVPVDLSGNKEIADYVETLKRTNEEMRIKLSDSARLQQQMNDKNKELASVRAELKKVSDEHKLCEQEKKLLADTITGLIGNNPRPSASDMAPMSAQMSNQSLPPVVVEEIFESIELFKGPNGLGFSIAGGADDPVEDGDASLYVTAVMESGAAHEDGRLLVGDKLVEVNGIKLEGLTHDEAVKILQASKGTVKLLVARLPLEAIEALTEEIEVIDLVKGDGGMGFSIAGGTDFPVEEGNSAIYITAVIAGGVAEKDGRLKVGDKLLKVNGAPLDNITHEQSVKILQATQKHVQLTVSRIPNLEASPSLVDQESSENLQTSVLPVASTHTNASNGNHTPAVLVNGSSQDAPAGEYLEVETPVFEDSVEEVVLVEFEKGSSGLGFSIAGGLDHPVQPDDPSAYVTHIIEGGAAEADGRLRVGDRLIEVNGVSVLGIPHDQVVKALQMSATHVQMKVSRLPTPKEELFTFHIMKSDKGGLGFSIAGGSDDLGENGDPSVYITNIIAGGAAEADGRLRIGDKLVTVNGADVSNIPHADTIKLLQSNPVSVDVTVSREVIAYHASEEVVTEVAFKKGANGSLGFSIAGGTDDFIEEGDSSIFITKIIDNSVAQLDGRLQFGDRILEVNGITLTDVTHEQAVKALQSDPDGVRMRVARVVNPNGTNELIEDIEVVKGPKGFGFSIAGGVDTPLADDDNAIYVTQVVPGGAAEQAGRLLLGDKILVINNVNVTNVSHETAVKLLQQASHSVKMIVMRVLPDEELEAEGEMNGE